MPTTISNATYSATKTLPAVPGVTPGPSNDGNGYTWSVSGESTAGDYLEFQVTGNGTDTGGSTSGNSFRGTMLANTTGQTTYVKVRASYSGASNAANWTVQASSTGGTPQTFRRGNGGGGGGIK